MRCILASEISLRHQNTLETPNTGLPHKVSRQSSHFCVFYHFSWFQKTWLHPPSCKEFRDPTFGSWKQKGKLFMNVSWEKCLLLYLVSVLTSWTFPSTWDDWFLHNTASPGQTGILAPTDLHTFKISSWVCDVATHLTECWPPPCPPGTQSPGREAASPDWSPPCTGGHWPAPGSCSSGCSWTGRCCPSDVSRQHLFIVHGENVQGKISKVCSTRSWWRNI